MSKDSYLSAREALDYACAFRGKLFVIRVDKDVANCDLQSGIVRDICLMSSIGVKIVLVDSTVFVDEKVWQENGIQLVLYQGENGAAEDALAAEYAIRNGAYKLIFLTKYDGLFDANNVLVRQVTVEAATELIKANRSERKKVMSGAMLDKVESAVNACNNGVSRVHIINGTKDGALIAELFSSSGIGTMICTDLRLYQDIRGAQLEDTEAIFEILHEQETLRLTKKSISQSVSQFVVYTLDNEVLACAQLEPSKNSSISKITHLVTSSSLEDGSDVPRNILTYLINRSTENGQSEIILTMENQHLLFVDPALMDLGFILKKSGGERSWTKSLT